LSVNGENVSNHGAVLSFPRLVGFGAGSTGTAAFVVLPQLFLLYICTELLGIPALAAGFVLFVPKVWEFVIDPYIGRMSDSYAGRWSNWGRRKPFMLIGSIAFAITFIVLFSPTPNDDWRVTFVFLVVAYVLCTTAFSLFAVPYIAIPADITEDPNERTRIVSFRMGGSAVGILFAGVLAPLLINWFGGGLVAYRYMAITIMAVLFIAMLMPLLAIPKSQTATSDASDPIGFWGAMKIVVQNSRFMQLMCVFVLQVGAVSASTALLPYLTVQVFGRPEVDMSILFAAFIVATLVSLPFWSFCASRLGKYRTYELVILACALAFCSLYLTASLPFGFVPIFVALIGFANGGAQLIPFSLFPDLIERDPMAAGNEGIHTGVWISSEKLGLALGGTFSGVILALSGYEAARASPSEATAHMILLFNSFGIAGINLVALFMLRRIKRE